MDTKDRSRAPKMLWEASLFISAIFVPMTLYPFLPENVWISPFTATVSVFVICACLISLSIVYDISPTFVENAEAEFQNRHASDLYSVPVVFLVTKTAVPGFSRIQIKRTDTQQLIRPWALRLEHSRRGHRN